MEDQNQTLYIRNINEKVKQAELSKLFYQMFSQFGNVLDVVCMKNLKMRGQAFVVFDSVVSATNALRAMQGFNFYDRPMEIYYAKGKSDVVAMRDGSYNPGVKKDRADRRKLEYEQAKKKQKRIIGFREDQEFKKLQVLNIPQEVTEEILIELFNQYSGFQHLRIKENSAIVEYASQNEALTAKTGLNNFSITPKSKLNINLSA